VTDPPAKPESAGAAKPGKADAAAGRVPPSVLGVSVLWAVILVALFVCFEEIDAVADFFPAKLGPLPFTSIWFGAAGGWLISIQGIFSYNREWDPSYDYWHYMRPLLGAFMGTLGCLIFVVLNDAATTTHQTANGVFYAVIAFVIGYREESFRTLVSKLVDTIILPSEKSSGGNSSNSSS
jgi:hypothetical protein